MLIDSVCSSEYTKQIADTDECFERALAGLMIAINAALHPVIAVTVGEAIRYPVCTWIAASLR
jgi:hypothetical protein